ncbi:MAG: hypothetical protein V4581_09150 [Bacteroidota bacterium]
MIKKIFKTTLCVALLLTTVVMHADPGMGVEDENGDIDEGGLEDTAPLDTNSIYLGFAGCAVALYFFNKKKVVA